MNFKLPPNFLWFTYSLVFGGSIFFTVKAFETLWFWLVFFSVFFILFLSCFIYEKNLMVQNSIKKLIVITTVVLIGFTRTLFVLRKNRIPRGVYTVDAQVQGRSKFGLILCNVNLQNQEDQKIYFLPKLYLMPNKLLNFYDQTALWHKNNFRGDLVLLNQKNLWKYHRGKLLKINLRECLRNHQQQFLSIHNLTCYLTEYICKSVKTHPNARSLILCLVTGDRSLIKYEVVKIFRKTGTAHLLAISGLHISVFTTFCYNLVHIGRFLSLNRGIDIFLKLIVFILSLIFLLVSGNSISAQRAVTMSMLRIDQDRTPKPTSIWVLCITGFFILLYDPLGLFSASFILSFGSVFVLVAGPSNKILKIFLLNLFLCPIMFFYYKEFNILSPIVNFFCIPFFSYVVMPSVMVSILWKKFFFIAIYSVELLLIVTKFFCDYGIYIRYQISGYLCFIICAAIGLLIFVWGENDRKKLYIKESE